MNIDLGLENCAFRPGAHSTRTETNTRSLQQCNLQVWSQLPTAATV